MIQAVRCREILKSARGNTLIGLLAGLAIMEITGTALVSSMAQFNKQQSYLDLKTSGQSLQSEMFDEFSKKATCTAAINTTQDLVQDGDGTWPISMTLPDLPDTLLTSGSSRVLGSYGLTVKRLYLDRLSDTGLLGTSGNKLYTGDVVVMFDSANDGSLTMRSQTVAQLFLEINNNRIISCASGQDPTTALLVACQRVGGFFNEGALSCSMDRLSASIIEASRAKVTQYLYSSYYNQLIAAADARINQAATDTFNRSVADADSYTNGARDALNGNIGTNSTNANNRWTVVNNTLSQNVYDLTNAINAANNLSNVALSNLNAANATTSVANGATASANAHSASAQSYADQANYISNQAVATAQAANNTAAQANYTAGSANGTTNYANAVTGQANNYINAANNAANAANSSASWANSTASSANNYASSAINLSNSANGYSSAAINTSNYSNSVAAGSNNMADQANAWSADARNWYNAWAGRQGYTQNNYNYQQRACAVGGPNCSWQ